MSGDILLMEEGAEPRPARRGFLRTLITAPIAALATHKLLIAPSAPIFPGLSPEDRLRHHLEGVQAAYRDLFPGVRTLIRGNAIDPVTARSYERLFRENPGNGNLTACAVIMASYGFSEGELRAGAAQREASR